MLHDKYLNPWCILAETGTSRHVIMMHFGNGDMENSSNNLIVNIHINRTKRRNEKRDTN